MEFLVRQWTSWTRWYDDLWELRDKRMDGLPLMGNPIYTIFLCALYVYVVKVAGPKYMKDRPPMNIKKFMVGYNAFQVILSGYIFVQVIYMNKQAESYLIIQKYLTTNPAYA